jgi:hypothetical protein
MSEGIGTPDDVWKFDDLPLLSEKGGDKSEDDSEGDITKFRGRTAKSRTEKASDSRNRRRTVEKDTNDERTLSKYIPNNISDVIGGPIDGPDDAFVPPKGLMEAIKDVYNTHTITPTEPPVRFMTDPDSLAFSEELLASHGYDMGALIRSASGSTMDPSSEFRPTEQLDGIFSDHPNYGFVRNMVERGMDYVLTTELDEGQRILEMEANITRGDHKSASGHQDHLVRLLDRDVKYGFAMPIPKLSVHKLKGAMVQPAGVTSQFTILENGSRTKKQRLTHDLTYAATFQGASVNSRIDMTKYPEMIYGWCLGRVIHFIVALRAEHPDSRIFIAKYDFSDAYRRVAHTARAAAQTNLVMGQVVYVMLSLGFRGSPNPPA